MMRLSEKDINIRCALVVYDSDGMALIEHPLGRAKKAGNYDLPKGHFDTTADFRAADAACRECEEETGLVFEPNDIQLLCVTNYGSDKLYLFALKQPYDFNLDELHCHSKIGPDCAQKWKIGLPEVDDYYSVPFDELRDWIYKSYNDEVFDTIVAWIDSKID